MTKKQKKENIRKAVSVLSQLYPDAKCSLDYDGQGWKLLVMARLSAQCTDERVNIVCKRLFWEYDSPELLANADTEEIEAIIKPCGLYKAKAKNIKNSCALLVEKYNGKVPQTMNELLEFDGVGRKIANLLLGDLYNLPAIVADTHCMRICGRLGFYKDGMKDPYKTEKILSSLVEPSEQSDFCHRLVAFGREFCTARNPKCTACPLFSICAHYGKNSKINQ